MFFNVCLHSRSFPLRTDWRKSDSSVDGEPQGHWRWNSNSRDAVASSPSFSRPAARAPRRACSQVIYILTLSSWLLRRRRPSLKVLISRSMSSFIRSSTRWSLDGNLKIKFYWMKSFIRLNFYFTSVFTPFNSSNRSQRKILLESTKFSFHSLFPQNHLTIHIHCKRELFLIFGTKNCLPKMPCFNTIKLNLITHLQSSFFTYTSVV